MIRNGTATDGQGPAAAWQRPNALLRHQHRLAHYLIHQACQKGALWRDQQSADRPQRGWQ
jgi:hypothetical protein